MRAGAGILVALAGVLSWEGTARAVDPFEIQVYEADIDPVGAFGLELHSNYVASGQSASSSPELSVHHVLHETLEPSVGVTSFLELGGYLQTALQPGGPYEFAGVKLRAKFRFPEVMPFRFAVNFELSWLPTKYSAPRWGSEVRPIIEWRDGIFGVRFNPIVSFDWTGSEAAVPHLEPALATTVDVGGVIALGLEYYADFGPIDAIPKWADQLHFIFETIDVIAFEDFELHAGIGEGLTGASSGVTVKTILGHTF
jgi:hypothetical protein